MRGPGAMAREWVQRAGLEALTRMHRAAADFDEAAAENRMLDVALAQRVAYLEQRVGEIAHKRSSASTQR